MDTNGDGVVDNLDDPYLPYYPGDAYVDWVGMSVIPRTLHFCKVVPCSMTAVHPNLHSFTA